MKKINIFQRLAGGVTALAMSLSLMSGPTVSAEGAESARSAVDNMNLGINLAYNLDSNGSWIREWGNTPDAWETAWGNPQINPILIKSMKAQGFNAVRVPITWAEHIDDKGNIDKAWLDRVNEVVDYIIDEDLYCIINVQQDAGSKAEYVDHKDTDKHGWLKANDYNYKTNSAKYANLWKNIAERFKDYDDKLIFEGFDNMLDKDNNILEPKSASDYKVVNDYNALFVKTVRASGGKNTDRNLMIQTYSAAFSVNTLDAFELPKDTVSGHLIVTVHNNEPDGFTSAEYHDYSEWTDTWGSSYDKSRTDVQFEMLKKFSDKIGAPVVVGEFRCDYKRTEKSRKAYVSYFTKTAAKNGIKCFWWDNGASELFNRKNGNVIYPAVIKAMTDAVSSVLGRNIVPKSDIPEDITVEGEIIEDTPVKTKKTEKDPDKDKKEEETVKASEEPSKVSEEPVKTSGKSDLKAQKDGISVKLSWKAVDGAVKYEVKQLIQGTDKYITLMTVEKTEAVILAGVDTETYSVEAISADGKTLKTSTVEI